MVQVRTATKLSQGSCLFILFYLFFFFQEQSHEDKLHEMCKNVNTGLMYFEVIARKKRLEQFPGSATQILEFVMKILDLLTTVHSIPRLK